ncbi:hypothetical protein ABZT08_07870 [Streptomyces sp. NPDC005526]|uniref:hypothetical protein n=1 Tax=Streptomyces sp. NPDC005526 TaxID=3156885 RepID=UPI0033A543C1
MTAPPIVVVGYLAVLNRLRAARLPRGDGDGEVCRPLTSTLTCDAPLVAAHLDGLGVRAGHVLSHPGMRPLDALSLTLLPQWSDPVRVGSWRGDPTEIEISTDDGQRVWFNCPAPGVASLRDCATGDAPSFAGSVVYMDAYPWLASACLDVVSAARPAGTVVVNLGRASGHTARRRVTACRRRLPTSRVLPQVCIPDLLSRESRAAAFHGVCDDTGCPLALITSGSQGLGLGGAERHHWWTPPREARVTDTSGAGAAVSAALLSHLLEHGPRWTDDTVHRLGEAGLRQCEVAGALPPAAQAEWNRHERLISRDMSALGGPGAVSASFRACPSPDDNGIKGY